WFDTQLTKQQVEVRLNTAMTADEVSSGDWEEVIVATGSEPARDGYQRALPFQERLPGVEADNVVAIDDVLAGDTNCGKRVLVLDDLGNWKGAGTALYLAERDHDVTIATRHPMIAPELVNSAATAPLVRRMAELKIKPLVDTVMLSWEGNVAALKSTLDGGLVTREFDTLVLATTNRPVRSLHDSLMGDENLSVHMIGDSLGARRASAAIYEGRKLALEI
ncbi:MAG: oxidoreductase, partial [Rhodospirillaceae bacterium]|nr:oxidoreductase [Rhodospirillaceae bacterium]MBT7647640.1 oxidoreductase [Rhodospirillaceae bacterium]